MSQPELSEADRKGVFAALVEAQDRGVRARQAREQTCRRFGLTGPQLLRIEEEGLEKQWPPLG